MENFKSYKVEKAKLLEKVGAIRKNLDELKSMGFDFSDAYAKLEQTVKSLDSEIISIVLVGSFSDGKTSVAAGWLGEKLDNMKIDSDESSDQLEIYKPENLPEKCEIVDTPGLFGSKEKEEDGKITKLSDITKKHIDEANLILYVVDAKNPVKDSHKETLRWILKDLHKIDTTIFVINKMDSVADLTDESEFNRMAKIKTETLKDKLSEIADLSPDELTKLKIVCVSSNPQSKGFDFWLQNEKVYKERSRIENLESTANNVLKNTSAQELVAKTGCDVLERVVRENVDFVENQINMIANDVIPKMEETLRRNNKDYENTRKQILSKKASYVRDLRNLEKKLKTSLRAASYENIGEFVRDEVGIDSDGNPGSRIEEEIELLSQEYFADSNQKLEKLHESIELSEGKQDEVLDSAISKGASALSTALKGAGKIPVAQMKDAILAGRNVLGKIFGTTIKFKPWGVTKLANGLLKGLPLIGAAVDVGSNFFEMIKANKERAKFVELKKDLEKLIENVFSSVVETAMDNEKYLAQFAPQLSEIKKSLDEESALLQKQRERRDKFLEWKNNAVDVDFSVAS